MTPCPVSQTSYNTPFCSHAVGPVGGLITSCLDNNCQQWGVNKAYDGSEAGINSLAITGPQTASFMQMDLGTNRTDVAAVRIAASSDPTYSYTLASNLDVYISSGLDAKATGTLCGSIGAYTSAGQAQSVACPSGASGRYITVFRTGLTTAASMAVQEISVLAAGEH